MFVKNFEKYQVFKDGSVLGASGSFLKPFMGRGGYLKVCLKDGSKKRWVYVHRLVCETWLDNPLSKKEINHKDGNKLNNAYDNLEWVTKSENGLHAFKNKLNVPAVGEKSGNHKLTENDIINIRLSKGKKTVKELSKIFGVNPSHICNIQNNRFWKHVEVANV